MVFFIPWRVVAEDSGAAHYGFGGALLLDLLGRAAAMADTQQVGANTVITYDANDTVTLTGVEASHLTASNFKFTWRRTFWLRTHVGLRSGEPLGLQAAPVGEGSLSNSDLCGGKRQAARWGCKATPFGTIAARHHWHGGLVGGDRRCQQRPLSAPSASSTARNRRSAHGSVSPAQALSAGGGAVGSIAEHVAARRQRIAGRLGGADRDARHVRVQRIETKEPAFYGHFFSGHSCAGTHRSDARPRAGGSSKERITPRQLASNFFREMDARAIEKAHATSWERA